MKTDLCEKYFRLCLVSGSLGLVVEVYKYISYIHLSSYCALWIDKYK